MLATALFLMLVKFSVPTFIITVDPCGMVMPLYTSSRATQRGIAPLMGLGAPE